MSDLRLALPGDLSYGASGTLAQDAEVDSYERDLAAANGRQRYTSC
jgi:hypothetical protein